MTINPHIPGAAARNFVFIDSRVAGWQALVEALPAGSSWQLVTASADGLAQIAAALAGTSGIQALHIVSHGAAGSVQLGASVLSAGTLPAHADRLAAIGAALEEGGDILLYGCEAGAGSAGTALVDTLAALTGADVAASTDATGAAALGGDWVLERRHGAVASAPLDGEGYLTGLLAGPVRFDFSSGTVQADSSIDGSGQPHARQIIGDYWLELRADQGFLSVVDEDGVTGQADPLMDGRILSVDANASVGPNAIALRLERGQTFDLKELSLFDLNATLETLVITNDRGQSVEINLNPASFQGQKLILPTRPELINMSSATFTDKDGDQIIIELDDIVLANILTPPSFSGSGLALNLAQNAGATDITDRVSVDDPDAGQTLSWSIVSGPTHGDLQFGNYSAQAGGSNIAPNGTPTYTPHAGYAGTDSFVVRVSDSVSSATQTIFVNVKPETPRDLDLSAASDTGANDADNRTNALNLTFSGKSAAGDSASTVRVFIDKNANGAYDFNDPSNTAQLQNGVWTVQNVSTSGLSGTFNAYAIVEGDLTSDPSAALQVTIDRTAPTTTFSGIFLSQDTGTNSNDLNTSVATQTVSATMSAPLAAGDALYASVNGGQTWSNITSRVSGTSVSWTGATLLAGTNNLMFEVRDEFENRGPSTSKSYTLDQAAPTTTVASARFSADGNNDFIVNTAGQDLSGTLSASLAQGELVEVSLNNGATWSRATATPGSSVWSLAGIALTTSATLQVRVSDAAGNHGSAYSQAYVYDPVAPSAAVQSTTIAPPGGTAFPVSVTYVDAGGAGIDIATFGTGNIGVKGPGGADLVVSGFAASGNTVTYTVQAPGGSWDPSDAGQYTVSLKANSVRDIAGNPVAASASAGTVDIAFSSAPPVAALRLSADNGISDDDFLTNVAAQTVLATLSRALTAGEKVEASLDNGISWTDITAKVSGTAIAWDGVVLPTNGILVIRALDSGGQAGSAASHAYSVDSFAPLQVVATGALAADTGLPGDFITNVAAQTLSGSLNGPLNAGEFVEVSLNNGQNWTTATTIGISWSLGGITLPASGTALVRVADHAGNQGTAWVRPYQLDTAAPSAGTPVRADMVNPSGASFTFTVTYADGGAGIDPATIGVGNVTVQGPAGTLSVSDASASGNTVTYTVAAPGGSWDAQDAGSYTIGINASVKDLAGNTVAATPSAHAFNVGFSSAPVLGGVFGTPSVRDNVTTAPFAGVTVADADGDALTLTIGYTAANGTLAGAGLSGSAGNYTLSGSAAQVQAALRALVFTPTENQSAGPAVATTFTLAASDGSATTTNTATVVTANPTAPTASMALVGTNLKPGSTGTLTIAFSEAVSGFTVADISTPNARVTSLASSDGGRNWTASLVPNDGVALGSYSVTLNLAGVVDAGGLAGSGNATGPSYTIHTLRPGATVSVADTVLTAGETTTVTITFVENIVGLDLADLAVAGGTLSGLSTADGGRTWTATLTPAAGAWLDASSVRLDLGGVMNASGIVGNGFVQSNPYAVHTGTPPVVPDPDPVPRDTIDGVPVTIGRQVDPVTGLVNSVLTVPVVTTGRPDDPNTPNATLADIPLSASGGGASSTLTVGLPVGAGLQASTPTTMLSSSQALLDLIHRIEQVTAGAAREEMSGSGTVFLQGLGSGTMLQTATLMPLAGGGNMRDILVTGNAPGANAAIGLVIDASGLPSGSVLQLNNVDFAAVTGAVTLRGGAGNNIVVGDGAGQNIYLGEGDDQLFGGGGNDVIGSAGGADLLDGGTGDDLLAGGIGNDTLAGGSGNDVLQGGRSTSGNWQFAFSANGVVGVTHESTAFAPGVKAAVALAELQRDSAGLGFLSASHATLTEMALLYQAAFGRAPDVGGLNFHLGQGAGAAAVAPTFLASSEWRATGLDTLSDGAFVTALYSQVLGREADSQGLAFWTAQLAGAGGVAQSRAEVLLGFALSNEHRMKYKDGIVFAAAGVGMENGWFGGSGDDRLEGGAGSDLLVGGDGLDTVVYAGAIGDYRFLLGADGSVKVADKANTDVDTLLGIERGAFRDVQLDLSFTQANSGTLATVGLLYQAVLDRPGDLAGVAGWAGAGLNAAALARGFAGSSEFAARYGAMSDAAFVAALYANSGLDTSAVGGSGAWVAMLHDHGRAELIGVWITQDAVRDAQFGAQGLWFA